MHLNEPQKECQGIAGNRLHIQIIWRLHAASILNRSAAALAVRSRFTTEVLDVTSLAQLTPAGETALQMARAVSPASPPLALALSPMLPQPLKRAPAL